MTERYRPLDALESGCLVDVLCCRDCQNIARQDLSRLAAYDRREVPLIQLPMVCRYGG
jgi:hypothetical protein